MSFSIHTVRRKKSTRIYYSNIQCSNKLDDYLVEILREKHKHATLAFDNIFKKFQKSNAMVMGRLWLDLEEAKESKTETVSFSLNELLYLTHQVLCLIGQTNNTISYHWRLNILRALLNQTQAKAMLKEHAEILQTLDSQLFGKEFRQNLVEMVKAEKQSKEIFLENMWEKRD